MRLLCRHLSPERALTLISPAVLHHRLQYRTSSTTYRTGRATQTLRAHCTHRQLDHVGYKWNCPHHRNAPSESILRSNYQACTRCQSDTNEVATAPTNNTTSVLSTRGCITTLQISCERIARQLTDTREFNDVTMRTNLPFP